MVSQLRHRDYDARLAVFGRPESSDDRMHRYMREGAGQYAASIAAWSWPSYSRDHAALAVETAQAWGALADLVLDKLDQVAELQWLADFDFRFAGSKRAEWLRRPQRRRAAA